MGRSVTLYGGLVGANRGAVASCNTTGVVSSTGDYVSGLVGYYYDYQSFKLPHPRGSVASSFWDIQTSGQATSDGGTGKTTAEMQTKSTFTDAGWNFEEVEGVWTIDEGRDYPRLRWEPSETKYGGGRGTAAYPYEIWTPLQMNAIGANPGDWDMHFRLMADIDLSGFDGKGGRPAFNLIAPALNPEIWYHGLGFTGVFDGNRHIISHLTITGESYLGLFCCLGPGAEVKDLGLRDVEVTGSYKSIGGLVGTNGTPWVEGGTVHRCYVTGVVSGESSVGGLVGSIDWGIVTESYNAATVSGRFWVGGLVGYNNVGDVTDCYSTGAVYGDSRVGGLIGVTASYASFGSVTRCYSTSAVKGTGNHVGGLVGENSDMLVTASFWDTQTSGQAVSASGTGKTTAEMQMAKTFLDAGWDIVKEETANGSEYIWWINEGQDYPRLWWEIGDGASP